MTVRRARPDEGDSVRALVQRVVDETYGGLWALLRVSEHVGRAFRSMPATHFGAAGRTGALEAEHKGSTGGRRGGVAALDRNRWPT